MSLKKTKFPKSASAIIKKAFGANFPIVQTARSLIFDPMMRSVAGQNEMIYTPGYGHFLDRTRDFYRWSEAMRSAVGASDIDRATQAKTVNAVLRNILPDRITSDPARLNSMSEALVDDIKGIFPILRAVFPEAWESSHGWRGSAMNLSERMYNTDSLRRDPITGVQQLQAQETIDRARDVYNYLYGPQAHPKLTSGYTANKIGELYNEMVNRGLLSGDTAMDSLEIAQRLSDMSQAAAAARDFVSAFRGTLSRPVDQVIEKTSNENFSREKKAEINVPVSASMDIVEALTKGQIANMDPNRAASLIRQLQAVGRTYPGGVKKLLEDLPQIEATLAQGRLPDEALLPLAIGSAAFADSWRNLAGPQGFGGLTLDSAKKLDADLRAGAINSPIANMMAATLALYDAGLIKPGSKGHHMALAIRNHQKTLPDGSSVIPNTVYDWVSMMADSGVSEQTAFGQLHAAEANKAYTIRHNIADFVRNLQGEVDVLPMMKAMLGYGMTGQLNGMDIPANTQANVLSDITDSVAEGLYKAPTNILSGPRIQLIDYLTNKVIRDHPKLINNLPANKIREFVHSGLLSMDNLVRTDPRMNHYKNFVGLVSAHRPALIHASNAARSDASLEAKARNELAHAGQFTTWQNLFNLLHQNEIPNFGKAVATIAGAVPKEDLRKAYMNARTSEINDPFFLSLPPEQQNALIDARNALTSEILGSPDTLFPVFLPWDLPNRTATPIPGFPPKPSRPIRIKTSQAKEVEFYKTQTPLAKLLAAKQESDRKNYARKTAILVELLKERGDEFIIDSEDGSVVGITHKPTNFKIHMLKKDIPVEFKLKNSGEPNVKN